MYHHIMSAFVCSVFRVEQKKKTVETKNKNTPSIVLYLVALLLGVVFSTIYGPHPVLQHSSG